MADTHQPISHFTPVQQQRSRPVPIRPAFRPLLPKPIQAQETCKTKIHIHTRASLAKKRSTQLKVDLQKRKRNISLQKPLQNKNVLSEAAQAAFETSVMPPYLDSPISNGSSPDIQSSSSSNSSSTTVNSISNPISVSTASIFGPLETMAPAINPSSLVDELVDEQPYNFDYSFADELYGEKNQFEDFHEEFSMMDYLDAECRNVTEGNELFE